MTLEEAIQEVQESFNQVVSYSQDYNTCDLNSTPILTQWYRNKAKFIEQFQGLIYESEELVSFELSDAEKSRKVRQFITDLEEKYQVPTLAFFVKAQADGFYSNRVTKSYPGPDGKTIPIGMKLVKAFKYFEEDTQLLDTIQSAASRIIQENKCEGKLCFSVHPLDFLSLSENTHNWRSCHALDGEYRGGNLSYMCDDTTIICYIKSDHEKERLSAFPPSIPWNSKKWRMLLYLNSSSNCMFAGRQYPFTCDSALQVIKERIIQVLNIQANYYDSYWSEWHDDQITSFSYSNGTDNFRGYCNNSVICIDNSFRILQKFVKDNSNLHYNDVLRSNYYKPYYCWVTNSYSTIKPFKIGSAPVCPVCGKEPVGDSDTLCCWDCQEQVHHESFYTECECCGSIVLNSELIYSADSRYEMDLNICRRCYEEQTFICACCGRRNLVGDGNMIYDKNTHQYICAVCYEEKE